MIREAPAQLHLSGCSKRRRDVTEIAFLVTMKEEEKTAKHVNRVVCNHASCVFCASFVTRLIHFKVQFQMQ